MKKKLMALVLSAMLMIGVMPLNSGAAPMAVTGMASGAHVLNGDKIEDFGNIILGTGSNILEIFIIAGGFGSGIADSDITERVMDNMELKFTDPNTEALFKSIHNMKHWTKDGNAKITLTAENIGRATGFVYIVYFNGYTYTESKYMPINGNFIDPTINKAIVGLTNKKLDSVEVSLNSVVIDPLRLHSLDVTPNSELRFKLDTEFFHWDPLITDMRTAVRKSSLDNDLVGIKFKATKGKEAIKYVSYENVNGRAYAIVHFTDDLQELEELDFDVTVFMTFRRTDYPDTSVQLIGTIENEVVYASPNDRIYIGDGIVVQADEVCENVQLELGCGVTVIRDLDGGGRRYYGRATDERDEGDMQIMKYYSVIKKVFTLSTKNLQGKNTSVSIDVDRVYYVYDVDGALLGTTAELLPYRNKYYLAIEKIEMDKSVIATANNTEADSIYSNNANDNPSTGA